MGFADFIYRATAPIAKIGEKAGNLASQIGSKAYEVTKWLAPVAAGGAAASAAAPLGPAGSAVAGVAGGLATQLGFEGLEAGRDAFNRARGATERGGGNITQAVRNAQLSLNAHNMHRR